MRYLALERVSAMGLALRDAISTARKDISCGITAENAVSVERVSAMGLALEMRFLQLFPRPLLTPSHFFDFLFAEGRNFLDKKKKWGVCHPRFLKIRRISHPLLHFSLSMCTVCSKGFSVKHHLTDTTCEFTLGEKPLCVYSVQQKDLRRRVN